MAAIQWSRRSVASCQLALLEAVDLLGDSCVPPELPRDLQFSNRQSRFRSWACGRLIKSRIYWDPTVVGMGVGVSRGGGVRRRGPFVRGLRRCDAGRCGGVEGR